jgi:ubiquinone/menaquinone biosynthesis C-methylase UbiE
MIDIAKGVVHNKSIKWQQADALELPFDDNSFDLVVIQFGIMFFPDKEKGLHEVFRVLKPGGKLIYNTWDKVDTIPAIHEGRKIIESYFGDNPPVFYSVPFAMYDENELRRLTEHAGFADVKIEFVKKEGVCESASDLAKGIVEGNPVYLSIMERIPASLDNIREDVKKKLIEKFGEPVKSPLQAWIVEANK